MKIIESIQIIVVTNNGEESYSFINPEKLLYMVNDKKTLLSDFLNSVIK